MTTRFLCLIALVACADPSEVGTVVEVGPDSTPDSAPYEAPDDGEPTELPYTPVDRPSVEDPPEEPTGCLYPGGLAPDLNALGDCRRDWLTADGQVVHHQLSTRTTDGSLVSDVRSFIDQHGELVARYTNVEGPDGWVYEATEHLQFADQGSLPCTYGMPAVTSRRAFYEDGLRVRVESGSSIDASFQAAEEWDYDEAGGVIEYRRLAADGEVSYRETFRPDGQPLTAEHTHGAVTRWFYDDAGLLTLQEKSSNDVVTGRARWTMEAPDRPLSHEIFRVGADGEETFEQDTQWEYDDGGLRVQTGSRVVYGYLRKTRREFDTLGNETYFREDTEDADCHRYEKRTTYEGDEIVSSVTTCDDVERQRVTVTLDAAGRPVHRVQVSGWSQSGITQTDRWEYGTCGAITFREHTYGDQVTLQQTNTWSPEGRLLTQTSAYHDNPPVTHSWEYDSTGRLMRTTSPVGVPLCTEGLEPTVEVVFDYCD